MHFVGAVTQLASKANDLANDQLGDTAGVAERRVEDGNTMLGGILEVDLVGTNTEASDHDQVLGLLEDSCGELGLGADADHMNVTVQRVSRDFFWTRCSWNLLLTESSQSAGPQEAKT